MNDFVITKKFDDLGRIVIPIEMRRYYGFEKDKRVQIIPQKNGILIVSTKKKQTSFHLQSAHTIFVVWA